MAFKTFQDTMIVPLISTQHINHCTKALFIADKLTFKEEISTRSKETKALRKREVNAIILKTKEPDFLFVSIKKNYKASKLSTFFH